MVTAKLLGLVFFTCSLEYFSLPHLAHRLFPAWSYLLSAIVLWFIPIPLLIWLPVISVIASSCFFTRRFNGGADSVMFWVGLLLALTYTTADSKTHFSVISVMTIGFVGAFAYFMAGVSKLLSPQWRTGETFQWSLSQTCFSETFPILRQHSRCLSLGILLWQLSFPLALTHRYLAIFYIVSGLVFHIVNARVLGLSRFTLAFSCFYPAILFLSHSGDH